MQGILHVQTTYAIHPQAKALRLSCLTFVIKLADATHQEN